jgi:hypothetical protein
MTALTEMDVRDVFNYAQVHLIVGVYFLVSSEVTTATRYIKNVASLIERSPGAFLPPLDGESRFTTSLEPSEEVQERFVLIAHIVNCRSLLQIHVLEKKTKTVHADVLNDLPVRAIITDPPPALSCAYLLFAGSCCAGSVGRSKRTPKWDVVDAR